MKDSLTEEYHGIYGFSFVLLIDQDNFATRLTEHMSNTGQTVWRYLTKFWQSLGLVERGSTSPKRSTRFSKTVGFLGISRGFFLKTNGFLPKVYRILPGVAPGEG